MKVFWWLATAGVLVLVAAACRTPQPQAAPQPDYRLTATVKDLMDSIVDPSADVLWESVATVSDATGVTERQPRTADEWAMVRHNAIALLEATNLLLMPGRAAAHPGEKAENPNVELEPQQIDARINADRALWTERAHGLHDAATTALKAIDAKDPAALLNAGETIDTACENCHKTYWYPADK